MYYFNSHIIIPVQKYDYTNKEDANMTNIEKIGSSGVIVGENHPQPQYLHG